MNSLLLSLFTTKYISRTSISWDGTIYLASAKSFLSDEMYFFYQWLREPFYPILIKVILFLSSSDLFLVFIQTFVLAVSFTYLLIGIVKSVQLILIIQSLYLISPTVAGFNGAILQQSIIASSICLLTGATTRLLTNKTDSVLTKPFIIFVIAGTFGVLTSFVVAPTYIVLSLILFYNFKGKLINGFKKLNMKGLLSLPIISLIIWYAFKYWVVGFEKVSTGNSWFFQFSRDTYLDVRPPRTLLALLGIGHDSPGPHIREIYNFGLGNPSEECGAVFNAPEEFKSYVTGYIDISCRNEFIYSFIQNQAELSAALTSFILSFGFIVSLLTMYSTSITLIRNLFTREIERVVHKLLTLKKFRSNNFDIRPKDFINLSLSISFLCFLTTYFVAAAGNSRYSFPLISLGIALILNKTKFSKIKMSFQ
jgi:hypothetical protein